MIADPAGPSAPRHQSRFWNFSRRIYARAEVREACLELQDSLSADVNILLFCLWRAADSGEILSKPALRQLDRAVMAWRRQVIRPLRTVRRGLADFANEPSYFNVREEILRAELAAEHAEQICLEALVPKVCASLRRDVSKVMAARQSVANYLGLNGKADPALFPAAAERLTDALR